MKFFKTLFFLVFYPSIRNRNTSVILNSLEWVHVTWSLCDGNVSQPRQTHMVGGKPILILTGPLFYFSGPVVPRRLQLFLSHLSYFWQSNHSQTWIGTLIRACSRLLDPKFGRRWRSTDCKSGLRLRRSSQHHFVLVLRFSTKTKTLTLRRRSLGKLRRPNLIKKYVSFPSILTLFFRFSFVESVVFDY